MADFGLMKTAIPTRYLHLQPLQVEEHTGALLPVPPFPRLEARATVWEAVSRLFVEFRAGSEGHLLMERFRYVRLAAQTEREVVLGVFRIAQVELAVVGSEVVRADPNRPVPEKTRVICATRLELLPVEAGAAEPMEGWPWPAPEAWALTVEPAEYPVAVQVTEKWGEWGLRLI